MSRAPELESGGVNSGSLRLKAAAVAASQPLSALLEITYRCNWRCRFCYNPRHIDWAPLSTPEWIGVLDDLRTLGTLTVSLTGGEPLARPDFFEIARAVRARSFALRVFTNGSLVDLTKARALAELQPLGVELSLHGSRASTHDAATGQPGSYDALFDGLRHLLAAGVPTLLKTPLTRLNEAELDGMIDLARSLGVPYQVDATLQPRDDGDTGPLAFSASPDAIRDLMQRPEVSRALDPVERRPNEANCGLGRITLAVDPEGDVFPCPQWRRTSLGNVRQTRLVDLWRKSPVRATAARVADDASARLAGLGGAVSRFTYCPATAWATTGDPLVPDPAFLTRAAIAEAIRTSLATTAGARGGDEPSIPAPGSAAAGFPSAGLIAEKTDQVAFRNRARSRS